MLQVENLTKLYGAKAAVDAVSFQIEAGMIVGLLGPNGAGKTTTLAMMLHLVRPTSGRVLINGADVWQQPQQALRSVGALIETPALYPYLTGAENLRVWALHAGVAADPAALLQQVGLHEAANQRVETFSQGMKQRLGLAQALLGDPQLIILDEPTVGIDPRGVVELRQLLHQLASNQRTILFSSHQLAEVQQICDQVLILNQGRCVAQGAVAELLGSGGRVLIRIEGDAATLERALAQVRAWGGGTKARLLDGRIDALLPADQTAALNHALVTGGFAVAELYSAAPSLEDFFLHLTAEA